MTLKSEHSGLFLRSIGHRHRSEDWDLRDFIIQLQQSSGIRTPLNNTLLSF